MCEMNPSGEDKKTENETGFNIPDKLSFSIKKPKKVEKEEKTKYWLLSFYSCKLRKRAQSY